MASTQCYWLTLSTGSMSRIPPHTLDHFPLVLIPSPLTKRHAMPLTVRLIPLGCGIHLGHDSIKPLTALASTLLMPLNLTPPSPTTKPDFSVFPPLIRVQCESTPVITRSLDNSLQVTIILQHLTNGLLLTASIVPLTDLDLVLSYSVL